MKAQQDLNKPNINSLVRIWSGHCWHWLALSSTVVERITWSARQIQNTKCSQSSHYPPSSLLLPFLINPPYDVPGESAQCSYWHFPEMICSVFFLPIQFVLLPSNFIQSSTHLRSFSWWPYGHSLSLQTLSSCLSIDLLTDCVFTCAWLGAGATPMSKSQSLPSWRSQFTWKNNPNKMW